MNYLKYWRVAAFFLRSLVGLMQGSPISPALGLEISIKRRFSFSFAEREE
jgi:hypothetical protein